MRLKVIFMRSSSNAVATTKTLHAVWYFQIRFGPFQSIQLPDVFGIL